MNRNTVTNPDAEGLAPGVSPTHGLGTDAAALPTIDDVSDAETQSPGTTGVLGGLSGVGSMGPSDLDSAYQLPTSPRINGEPLGDSE